MTMTRVCLILIASTALASADPLPVPFTGGNASSATTGRDPTACLPAHRARPRNLQAAAARTVGPHRAPCACAADVDAVAILTNK